jgi:CubicO group peptidase (beta-lactamase class C family)
MLTYPQPTAAPESQGVDSAHLLRLLDHVREQHINLHSLLIARHGHPIAEVYFHPYHAASLHDLRSAGKSVTALLVGIALEEEAVASLDQPALSFFPDRVAANSDPWKDAITIRHLLTMTSGLALTDADSGYLFSEPDALQWVLDAPVAAEPGASFVYSSSNTYLLAAILEKATGTSLADYARAKLFGPLGIETFRWQTNRQGITFGFGGLWLASRDFTRLGQLVLDRGRPGEIVPDAWIESITRVQVAEPRYSFGWWIEPERGAVMMSGYGGQIVYILLERDLVLTITAGLRDPMPVLHRLIDTFILPALHDAPLPGNPGAAADLAAQIAALGQPDPQPVPPLPEIAARISGRRWRLGDNNLGLSALTITFESDAATLTLESGGDRVALPLGLDGVLRDVLVKQLGPIANRDRMAATGVWRDDYTLDMTWYSVNNPEYWRVEMAFDGEHGRLRWEDALSGAGETVATNE